MCGGEAATATKRRSLIMLKNIGLALAMLTTLLVVPSQAQEKRKMCPLTISVPCEQITGAQKGEVPEYRAEPTRAVEKAGEVCKTECLSDRAWQLSHSKCWWADSKDHNHRTPRFCEKCGTVCKPHGFPKMGHLSRDTNEWTVFRFGGDK